MHKPTPNADFRYDTDSAYAIFAPADLILATCSWTTQLREIFESCGMAIEAFDKFWCREEYRLPWMQSKLLGMEDLVLDADPVLRSHYQELVRQLSLEMRNGITVEAPLFCIVGKKMDV